MVAFGVFLHFREKLINEKRRAHSHMCLCNRVPTWRWVLAFEMHAAFSSLEEILSSFVPYCNYYLVHADNGYC